MGGKRWFFKKVSNFPPTNLSLDQLPPPPCSARHSLLPPVSSCLALLRLWRAQVQLHIRSPAQARSNLDVLLAHRSGSDLALLRVLETVDPSEVSAGVMAGRGGRDRERVGRG